MTIQDNTETFDQAQSSMRAKALKLELDPQDGDVFFSITLPWLVKRQCHKPSDYATVIDLRSPGQREWGCEYWNSLEDDEKIAHLETLVDELQSKNRF